MPSRDPVRGLPRERTGLAWERSALGFAGLAGIVLGVAARRDVPTMLLLSAALVGVAIAAWRHGRRAYARSTVEPHPRAVALLSVATALVALAAAVAVLARL
jgi:uncharacterized membrane protein YidH (DUF202 family)